MRGLINKYFDYIGIKNSILKKCVLLFFILWSLYTFGLYLPDSHRYDFHLILLNLFLLFLLFSLFIKIFNSFTKWFKGSLIVLKNQTLSKYFSYIGIKHEGFKRLTIIGIIILSFLSIFWADSEHIHSFLEIDNLWDLLLLIGVIVPVHLFLSMFFLGLIIIIFKWLIEGFKK